jgi:hypothetical protein
VCIRASGQLRLTQTADYSIHENRKSRDKLVTVDYNISENRKSRDKLVTVDYSISENRKSRDKLVTVGYSILENRSPEISLIKLSAMYLHFKERKRVETYWHKPFQYNFFSMNCFFNMYEYNG